MELEEIIIIIGVIAVIVWAVKANSKKDGKWDDSAVDKERILEALDNYSLTKRKYNKFKSVRQAEVAWNKDLEEHFSKKFLHVRQGSASKAVEIDLDIGRGKYGIELKWADKISTKTPSRNTIGQIKDYYKNGHYEKLLLVVAGTAEHKHNNFLSDIKEDIKKDYACDYYYMEITKNMPTSKTEAS